MVMIWKEKRRFFDKHPALWVGLLMLSSCGLGYGWSHSALIPWLILLLSPLYPFRNNRILNLTKSQEKLSSILAPTTAPSRAPHKDEKIEYQPKSSSLAYVITLIKNWRALLLASLFCGFCYFYTLQSCPIAPIEQENGIGYFQLSEIQENVTPFGKTLLYRGILRQFHTHDARVFRNIPCHLYITGKQKPPNTNSDYLLSGALLPRESGVCILKSRKPWKPVPGTFSSAEWRYRVKKIASRYLARHFGNSKVFSLFSALALGTIHDRDMVDNFRQLGVSHLLAISGFHFALAASFAFWLFKPILRGKWLPCALFLFCTAYALFLGSSPSILRAYIAISLFLIARFFDLRTTGLNALGVGLIIELLIDPTIVTHIGFGFSFLATIAIFLLYSPCERALRGLFLVHKMDTLNSFTLLDKHLYLLGSCLRKVLALNLSVHILFIPASLLCFHSFPTLSFFYNIFLPSCIGCSLFFLFITIPIDIFFPYLGALFHRCNLHFAQFLLDITHPPLPKGMFRVHTTLITPALFSLWLLLVFASFLYWQQLKSEERFRASKNL
jgi:competence protein ComEC